MFNKLNMLNQTSTKSEGYVVVVPSLLLLFYFICLFGINLEGPKTRGQWFWIKK